jgi:hypothetical protein
MPESTYRMTSGATPVSTWTRTVDPDLRMASSPCWPSRRVADVSNFTVRTSGCQRSIWRARKVDPGPDRGRSLAFRPSQRAARVGSTWTR